MAAVFGKSVEVESEQEFEQALVMPQALTGEWNPFRGYGTVEFTTIQAAVAAYRQL